MDRKETPVIQRRKRREARPVRELTPPAVAMREDRSEPRRTGSVKSENSSEARRLIPTESERRSRIDEAKRQKAKASDSDRSDHKSKILGRRDKTFATQLQRSLSQPREVEDKKAPENATDILSLLKRAKRSLSQPRLGFKMQYNEQIFPFF
jgi:hypothetical protein